jgi:hypothetical protein
MGLRQTRWWFWDAMAGGTGENRSGSWRKLMRCGLWLVCLCSVTPGCISAPALQRRDGAGRCRVSTSKHGAKTGAVTGRAKNLEAWNPHAARSKDTSASRKRQSTPSTLSRSVSWPLSSDSGAFGFLHSGQWLMDDMRTLPRYHLDFFKYLSLHLAHAAVGSGVCC